MPLSILGSVTQHPSRSVEISFGKTLKALRARKGLSQDALAHVSKLDRTYISLLERGLRQPTLKTLLNLSHSLGLDPREMFKAFLEELEGQNTHENR